MQPTRYLALETTGLDAKRDEVLEVSLLDATGTVLLDSLVQPLHRRHWIGSQAIHGIRPADVHEAPRLDALRPRVLALLTDAEVVIYDAAFASDFLPEELAQATTVHCAMRAFDRACGSVSPQGGYRHKHLQVAAARVGFEWPGPIHRSLHDGQATHAIWEWLQQSRLSSRVSSGCESVLTA